MTKYLVVFCLLAVNALGDSEINWRIVGGSNAPDGEYKYQVSIWYNEKPLCGGAFISDAWVITAAHCLIKPPIGALRVFAGTNHLDKRETAMEYIVKEVHRHEGYDTKRKYNDVAIIRIYPISYDDNIQPILVDKDFVEAGEDVIATGWGLLSYNGVDANDLQHIHLETITAQRCQKMLNIFHVHLHTDTQICTYSNKGGMCFGDSGGPLVRSVNGTKKLVGIVSGGYCGKGPDVFTRVSSYVSWLNKKCDNCLA